MTMTALWSVIPEYFFWWVLPRNLEHIDSAAADFDTDNGTELQLSYSLTDSATVAVSYNEDKDRDDDDDYTPGTQAKISFNF